MKGAEAAGARVGGGAQVLPGGVEDGAGRSRPPDRKTSGEIGNPLLPTKVSPE